MTLFRPQLWLGLLLAFVLAAPVLAAPKFPALTGRVVDDAGILSPAAEAKLTAELDALEQQTGHQLVVATLPTLQGYEIEDYGYQLLRAWGVGREKVDDGAILIVAPNERKVRVEVGYGLEGTLTDALSSLIIHRAILPAFREGRLEDGVVGGAEQIIRQIGLPEDQAKAAVAEAEAQAQQARQSEGDGGSFWGPIITIVIVLWVLSGILRMFGVRRRFGGSGLWWMLPMIIDGASRRGGDWSGGGGGWSSGGGGGFSGGGGSGGGGGASGSW